MMNNAPKNKALFNNIRQSPLITRVILKFKKNHGNKTYQKLSEKGFNIHFRDQKLIYDIYYNARKNNYKNNLSIFLPVEYDFSLVLSKFRRCLTECRGPISTCEEILT